MNDTRACTIVAVATLRMLFERNADAKDLPELKRRMLEAAHAMSVNLQKKLE